MLREEDADEEVKAMLQEVRTLSKEAFFGDWAAAISPCTGFRV